VTLSGGGGTGKCHRMTQGGGKGLANVSCDIFSKNFNYIKVFWLAFLKEKGYFFWKIKLSRHTGGGGAGGSVPMSQNDTWGGGLN
jgi:hypothetical protein